MAKPMEQMSLEEKVGQLFVIGFHSDQVDDHARTLIAEHHAGNIILFRRNWSTRERLKTLTRDLQALLVEHNGVPGWISVDQEGGTVSRVTEPYAVFPGAMACAAGATEQEVFRLGAMMGEELLDAGINMNYAPVLDVNNNPLNPVIGVRSFGDDPARVAAYGTAMFQGLSSAGVMPVGKHFPGHGDTAADSHLTLPVVPHGRERVEAVELAPFRAAVNAGLPAVMTTHILFPGIDDSGVPATLSKPILTGCLRGELGFKGLIITDCMQMQAISDNYGTPEGCVAALRAGADMVPVCHDARVQIAAMQAVAEAVRSGRLSEAELDAHVRRVLEAKREWIVPAPPALDDAALAGHRAFAAGLTAGCVTLVRDAKGLLPLTGKKLFSLSPAYSGLSIAEDPEGAVNFAAVCAARFGGDHCNFDVDRPLEGERLERILSRCAEAEVVVMGTGNAVIYPEQGKLLRQILALNVPVVQCALRLPYDAGLEPRVSTVLCSYDYTHAMMDSLLKVLAGEAEAKGRLPVKIG